MRVKQITVKTVSPKKFLVTDKSKFHNVYEFPFEAVDQSRERLGTIVWKLETFTEYSRSEKQYYINKLWLWASQTRDERYIGKIFEIPCFTKALHGTPTINYSENKDEEPFLQRVWRFEPFADNGNYVFSAYPRHDHNLLRISIDSSVFISPKFLTRRRFSN